ncbi:Hsp20/alpha crystallin family protein [Floccifex sp.]|uniref:Hsp20/alpha crystallin family protein n=1 Tax=Floccifex sp. TaxID=2815810 RepID=UPI003F1157BC|nr:Hsp20/alpha crystallin family protein [Erysipelotrichaceae bacterium]
MMYYPTFDLFDDFFTGSSNSDFMKTDIVEKDNNYELSIEMPGVKKENIQMELKNGYLKVGAKTSNSTENKDENGRIVRKERFSGSYARSFYVGENVRQEDVKASFDNGELKIVLPKEAPKRVDETRYIPIE